jgi:SAM-dependent methyltransferase
MKNFWDERYSRSEYVYGEEPNTYFKTQLDKLQPGKILLPAEGEGRNAVYAAERGWEVFAFDQSTEGKKKAEALARKKNVRIDYQIGDCGFIQYPVEMFDAIGLIYVHFPSIQRGLYHQRMSAFLKPGGMIILEAFNKKHFQYQQSNPTAGGPKDMDMLYSTEELKLDFSGFDILELRETEIDLEQSLFHSGPSSVIRFLGRKNEP